MGPADPEDFDAHDIDWECEAVTPIHMGDRFVCEPGENWIGYRDRELRPIRDPGDDAVDQTLLWKPVPSGVTAC